jgi:hypothetical protein
MMNINVLSLHISLAHSLDSDSRATGHTYRAVVLESVSTAGSLRVAKQDTNLQCRVAIRQEACN